MIRLAIVRESSLPFLAAVVGLAACSSFGRTDEAPAGDAGADAPPPGATSDAGDGAASACPGLFCTGFDEPIFDDGWSTARKQGGALLLAPAEDRPRSAPRVLRLTVPAVDGRLEALYLARVVSGVPTAPPMTVTYGYWMRLTRPNTLGGTHDVAELLWGAGDAGVPAHTAKLRMQNDALRFEVETDGASPLQNGDTTQVTDAEWHAVTIQVQFHSPKNATAEAKLDGARIALFNFEPKLPQGQVEIRLGATYTNNAWSETVIDFDDVTVAAQ